jgi:catechol 2,3-dioxygenase-like lactoylglutathione lyase family enzyme
MIRLARILQMKRRSIRVSFFGLCCSLLCLAQAPDLNGIAHLAFRVSDVQASRAFYEKLGFEQAFELTKNGKTTEAFIKVNDRQFIELYPENGTPDTPVGLMHFCFEAANLDELHDEYVRRGLTPTPVRKAGAGNLLLTMRDPENQLLEYTQYMPGSLHSNDRGQHLGTHRISDHLAGATMTVHDLSAEETFYHLKLAFVPRSGSDTRHLRIPGSSNEAVKLVPAAGNPDTTVFFTVADLSSTADDLRRRGLRVKMDPAGIALADPDGNIILLTRPGHP